MRWFTETISAVIAVINGFHASFSPHKKKRRRSFYLVEHQLCVNEQKRRRQAPGLVVHIIPNCRWEHHSSLVLKAVCVCIWTNLLPPASRRP